MRATTAGAKTATLPTRASQGLLYLVLAVVIFGAANAIVRRLADLGAQNLIDGRNPVSFCNVLFVGNLCAFALLAMIYRRDLKAGTFRGLSWQQIGAMSVVAALGTALAPALIFSALSQTSVNTVVLISRIEPPLILALSVILLDEKINRWIVGGAVLSFLGVIVTVVLQARGSGQEAMGIGNGEFWTAIAAIALALSTIISKVSLRHIPLGVFSIYRMAAGTAVFFVLAIVLFGPRHFTDAGAPFLWRWIVLYALGIVVAGQLLWFYGLRTSSAREVSLVSTLNPIAGVMAALLILGEAPTGAQIAGGVLILAGMAVNQWGLRQLLDASVVTFASAPLEADGLGFKGI